MFKFKLFNDKAHDIAELMSHEALRTEADRDLARRSIADVLSYFVLWAIIYYASGLEQASDALLEFLGFMLAAAGVGRLYLAFNFHRLYVSGPRLWRWLFGVATIISASIWGGVAALALSYDGLGTTSMMVILSVAGIAAGGIVTLAPAAWLGGLLVVVLLFPIIPLALFSDQLPEKGVALLFLTFFIFMVVIWRQQHKEYWRALGARGELMQARDAAEAATRTKGQFIASVSHELRTPLTSIIGALGMIESYPPKDMDEQTTTLVGIAYENGKRLSLLINDLLDFEKLNADHMEFDNRLMVLSPFLQQAIELNRSYAENYQVTIQLRSVPEDIRIVADEHRLMQVMTNLLSNAAKHSPAGDVVQVSVTQTPGTVRVAVCDHGPGVPEEFREHIFKEFTQAESSNTSKKSGTGLGLAISKAIVEKSGGTIGFDSVKGQGTTFYFELPLGESPPAL